MDKGRHVFIPTSFLGNYSNPAPYSSPASDISNPVIRTFCSPRDWLPVFQLSCHHSIPLSLRLLLINMPSVCPIKKNSVEKIRREALTGKIADLKTLLCPSSPDLSRNETLELAVSVLTGTIFSNPSTPKTKKPMDRKQYKKEHEQARRNKEAAAYNQLKQWINDNKLAGLGSRLDKNTILDIVLAHLRSTGTLTPSSSASSSSVPPLVPLILLPPTPPSSSSTSPPAPLVPVSSLPFSISTILRNPSTPSPPAISPASSSNEDANEGSDNQSNDDEPMNESNDESNEEIDVVGL